MGVEVAVDVEDSVATGVVVELRVSPELTVEVGDCVDVDVAEPVDSLEEVVVAENDTV